MTTGPSPPDLSPVAGVHPDSTRLTSTTSHARRMPPWCARTSLGGTRASNSVGDPASGARMRHGRRRTDRGVVGCRGHPGRAHAGATRPRTTDDVRHGLTPARDGRRRRHRGPARGVRGRAGAAADEAGARRARPGRPCVDARGLGGLVRRPRRRAQHRPGPAALPGPAAGARGAGRRGSPRADARGPGRAVRRGRQVVALVRAVAHDPFFDEACWSTCSVDNIFLAVGTARPRRVASRPPGCS